MAENLNKWVCLELWGRPLFIRKGYKAISLPGWFRALPNCPGRHVLSNSWRRLCSLCPSHDPFCLRGRESRKWEIGKACDLLRWAVKNMWLFGFYVYIFIYTYIYTIILYRHMYTCFLYVCIRNTSQLWLRDEWQSHEKGSLFTKQYEKRP